MKFLNFFITFSIFLFLLYPSTQAFAQTCDNCYLVPLSQPCNTGDVLQNTPAPNGSKYCGPLPNGVLPGGAPKIGTIDASKVTPVSVPIFISNAVNIMVGLAGLIFFFILILGGFQYLTSNGDEKATAAAQGTLTNAFIGLIIVVASFLIAQLVFYLFKIPGVLVLTPR